MGVDLRTGGKEGIRVYAPEDGYVWRIKTSYRGYGKALYIRGNSGRIYVFFHLQKYNWDIGTYLRERQIETKRYYQDIDPGANRLRVKKGDLIARSGQTGTGAPHLHFEVRDADNRPTNPLYYAIDSPDTRSPEFEAVWLTYLDEAGALSGDGRREIFLAPAYDKKNERFIITDTVLTTGRFSIKAAVSDYVGQGSFLLGPSAIKLYIDDVLYHGVEYARLDYSEEHFSLLDRDFDPAKEEYKRVFNLYRKPGNRLSIYQSEIPGDGSFSDTTDGLHMVRIEASDPSGHTSRLEFAFYYLPGGDILAPLNRSVVSDSLITLFLSRDEARELFDSVSLLLSNGRQGGDTIPVALYPETQIEGSMIRLAGDFAAATDYQLRFTKNGIAHPPYYFSTDEVVPGGEDAVVEIKAEIIEGGILLTALAGENGINWLAGEVLTDRGRERFFYRKTGGRRFSHYYQPTGDVQFIHKVETRGPVGFRPDTLVLNIHHVRADSPAAIDLMPGCRLVFSGEDLFNHALISVRDTVMPLPATGYFIRGPYVLLPEAYSFADWADLQTMIDETSVDPTKIGLYVYDEEDGEWSWAGGTFDPETRLLHSDLGGAAVFAVIADTAAPVITDLNIEEFDRVKIGRPPVRFQLEDELSGIEDDLNFDVAIDGRWIVPEYDPERKHFESKPHWRLVGGRHRLTISVHDRCGNRVSVTREFMVGAGP